MSQFLYICIQIIKRLTLHLTLKTVPFKPALMNEVTMCSTSFVAGETFRAREQIDSRRWMLDNLCFITFPKAHSKDLVGERTALR